MADSAQLVLSSNAPMHRRLSVAFVTLAFLFTLRAADIPAPTPPLTPITYYADWFPGAQFVGIYVAQQLGYYRDAGLDLKIVPFAYGQKTTALIDATPATCSVATSEGYIFLQKRAAGTDLKALGAVLQRAPAGFMSLRASEINSVRDFAGKTIGVHKFADPLYRWFLSRAEVPEAQSKMLFVGDDLKDLTSGKVSAMQGFATEEFVKLKRLIGDEAVFLSFAELGFDSYSQLIYTTAPQVARHRDTLRRFIAATRLGWSTALAQPDTALNALRSHLDPATYDEDFQLSCLIALRDYVTPNHQRPLAPLDPAKLTLLEETCVDIGLLKTPEPVSNFIVDLERP
jgi:ABC-type nitrate/sulfonate/bicarbonate transport system substrate-binding protein